MKKSNTMILTDEKFFLIISILKVLTHIQDFVSPICLICLFIITIIKYLPLIRLSESSGSGITFNLILYKKEVNYHLWKFFNALYMCLPTLSYKAKMTKPFKSKSRTKSKFVRLGYYIKFLFLNCLIAMSWFKEMMQK